MSHPKLSEPQGIPCCPQLDTDPVCDALDFRNRLTFSTKVRTRQGLPLSVEVTIHTRFTRCSGPLALGDLVYSTSLLPGEKVRLATTDHRSRFSFDSESNLSYRSQQISEEQYRMTALRTFMFDASATDQGKVRDTEKGAWDFHGDASGSIGLFSASASANARGSHNAESTHDWLTEHKQHASSSDNQSVSATRQAHSMSIGEVSTREHKEGETQDHYESSSREFTNANKCHAATFLFYRINKTETIKFTIESIERRVMDPAAPVVGVFNPVAPRTQLAVIPQDIPATSNVRVTTAEINQKVGAGNIAATRLEAVGAFRAFPFAPDLGFDTPVSADDRNKALAEVDAELSRVGLLDPDTKTVSKQAQAEFGFERKTSLPTPGVIVKGCLDDCDVCEPELRESIKLDLENKKLQNKLLERQIELLDKAQEYRCCPDDDDDDKPSP